jgi:hypothetical protein
MLACELRLAGGQPVVLEHLPAPSRENRANGLVGRVVGMLDVAVCINHWPGKPSMRRNE